MGQLLEPEAGGWQDQHTSCAERSGFPGCTFLWSCGTWGLTCFCQSHSWCQVPGPGSVYMQPCLCSLCSAALAAVTMHRQLVRAALQCWVLFRKAALAGSSLTSCMVCFIGHLSLEYREVPLSGPPGAPRVFPLQSLSCLYLLF